MIGPRTATALLFYIVLLPAFLAVASHLPHQQIQGERNDLRITDVDSSEFPRVSVRILTTSEGGGPIDDLARLVLRENGQPVSDTTVAHVPVGVDLVFVVDANADFLLYDDGGEQHRGDKVAASITRFAESYMNPAGLDRVSVIVPDETGENPVFLVEDTPRPDELGGAIGAYVPVPPRLAPLQAMLAAAIDHLTAADANRFRAILLFTDGARLGQQLDYNALSQAALEAGIPVYVAILGAEASPEEVDNVTRLQFPTNGQYVHMPDTAATDPIYELFRDQGQQPEISYVSAARQNGTQEVAVSLGNVRYTAEFDLALGAPEVAIEIPEDAIRRAGGAPDTPLMLLQPAVLPLTAHITWPDGRPRNLTEVVFRVDGDPQPLASELAPDGTGSIVLSWDISERDEGTYRLEFEVVDELGFRAAARPVEVTIEVARPSPIIPTPVPTAAPATIPGLEGSLPWLPVVLALLAGVALSVIGIRRRKQRASDKPAAEPVPRIVASPKPADDRYVAVLVYADAEDSAQEQIILRASDMTFGREPGAVDIVLHDPGISRLHARIRRTDTGDYWLFDEGRANGTFLNYERLGLAPRQLQHGDNVQFGRLAMTFRLELPHAIADAAER
jgi:hypothetical protein